MSDLRNKTTVAVKESNKILISKYLFVRTECILHSIQINNKFYAANKYTVFQTIKFYRYTYQK